MPVARTGRRPGQTETREAIADAARRLFAEKGYDGTTIRAVAYDAGVNPALVHHFFGSKEQVFVAALNIPVNPEQLVAVMVDGPREHAGERIVRFMLELWREPASKEAFLALIRSVTANEQVAAMMRQFLGAAVLAKVADGLGVSPLRMTAVAGQMMGLAMLRYVVAVEPVASADEEQIVELIAPVIQQYVDGAVCEHE